MAGLKVDGVTYLGVTGHFGSGKDTVANLVVDALSGRGYAAKRFAFADGVKETAREYFGWDEQKSEDGSQRQHLEGEIVYPKLIGGRTLLQGIGVMLRDLLGPDVWVTRLNNQVTKWYADHEVANAYRAFAVISDVRFVNEAELVDTLFRIDRPGHKGDGHSSETIMDTEPFVAHVSNVVRNDSGLDVLQERVQAFVSELVDA